MNTKVVFKAVEEDGVGDQIKGRRAVQNTEEDWSEMMMMMFTVHFQTKGLGYLSVNAYYNTE